MQGYHIMIKLSSRFDKKIKEEWLDGAYGGLPEGQRLRGRGCNRCYKAEIQKESSENPCALSLYRTAKGLEYNCFKPSCELGSGTLSCYGEADRPFAKLRVSIRDQSSCADIVPAQHPLPAGAVAGVTEHRRCWLSTFGLGAVDIARYSLHEHPADSNGIYFPQYDIDRNYLGYLRREVPNPVAGDDTKYARPKWVSMLAEGTVPSSRAPVGNKIVFIVEDVVSLIRLGKKHFTLAVVGTVMSPMQEPNLLKALVAHKAEKVIVALDPDAYDKAKIIEKHLTRYFSSVKAIATDQDPKYWSDEQLERYTR